MVVQSSIILAKTQLINFLPKVDDMIALLVLEMILECRDGGCYPINKDCWGTLAINARLLATKLESLATRIDKARSI